MTCSQSILFDDEEDHIQIFFFCGQSIIFDNEVVSFKDHIQRFLNFGLSKRIIGPELGELGHELEPKCNVNPKSHKERAQMVLLLDNIQRPEPCPLFGSRENY